MDFLWQVGDDAFLVSVRQGRVEAIKPADKRLMSWDFSIRGRKSAWEAHWSEMPEPTYHDIIAMRTAGHITIEGNLHPFFSNILYVKRLLELPRETGRRA